jgi:hypothetical protein
LEVDVVVRILTGTTGLIHIDRTTRFGVCCGAGGYFELVSCTKTPKTGKK